MQIVFAHHHLNPGGVTQVILNQLLSLAKLPARDQPTRVGVLYGGRAEGWPASLEATSIPFEVQLLPLPSIDYDTDTTDTTRGSGLAKEVCSLLAQADFYPGDTLLHLHNHALGKNVAWTGAIPELAKRGYRLLLQIHDFAEDFRPANYRSLARGLGTSSPKELATLLYPQAEAIHYATLTRRDGELLRRAGLPENRRHLLPNPVGEFSSLPSFRDVSKPLRIQLGIPTDAELVLYPVRGIRRKNLGELLLHAAISLPSTWHAVTLAPQNPAEQPSYDRWRKLAKELNLRCLFDCCGAGKSPFLDALAGCDRLLTTSVAEGFGMVFLEAWKVGKPLFGRDLPEITEEFREAGLQFGGLQETFPVPLDWLADRSALADAIRLAYDWACGNYGEAPAATVDLEIREILAGETIDFALLPSPFQESILRHVANDPASSRQRLASYNPGGESPDASNQPPDASNQPIEANAQIVRSAYSLETIGWRLREVYASLARCRAAGEPEPLPYGESILHHFLCIQRLHPIRFE